MATDHGLPQDPGERCQEVGSPHVSSDLPDVVTSLGQRLLGHKEDELLKESMLVSRSKQNRDISLLLDQTADTSQHKSKDILKN